MRAYFMKLHHALCINLCSCNIFTGISVYLEVLDAIILIQIDLEDFYRWHVRSQTSQALLPTAPDTDQ